MNSDTQWLRAEVLPLPKTPPRMCESNSVWTVMIYVIPQLQLKCTTVIVKRGQRRHITGGRISCTADLITASLQRPRRLSKVRLKCWVIQFTLILHDAHTLITLLNKQRSASREPSTFPDSHTLGLCPTSTHSVMKNINLGFNWQPAQIQQLPTLENSAPNKTEEVPWRAGKYMARSL